jgi:protein SCO1/2
VKRLAATLLALACAPAAWAQPSWSPAPVPARSQPAILREVGFDQNLGQPVPLDAAFRDESGKSVRLGDYLGKKPVVLTLVYYECPMLCTLTLNGLASALGVLSFDVGKEFDVVTVSFEPKETPALAAAKKKTYLGRYKRPGAEQGWHFLTGDEAAVRALTRAVGFRYAWDEKTKQYAHPSGIMVLTPEGLVSRYLYGVEYAPKDLRLALVEASQNRIGTAVDQVMLYCYKYDPETGKYGAMIMRMVRLGGALTVLALGAFLVVMWRRERRAAAVALERST